MADEYSDRARVETRRFLPVRTVLAVAVLAALVLAGVWTIRRSDSDSELLGQARRALVQLRPDRAAEIADELLVRNPDSVPALELAANAAKDNEDFERALGYLKRIPSDDSDSAVRANLEAGSLLLLNLFRPSEAESYFRRVLKRDPLHVLANHRMGYLLGLGGRNREAIPYRLRLIQLEHFEPVTLYLLCRGHTLLENDDQLRQMYEHNPDDPVLMLGMARHAIDEQDTSRSVKLLTRVISLRPELLTAQAMLGELHLASKSDSEFRQWNQHLPSGAEQNPDVWAVRGTWAQRHNQTQAAIRCFGEAVRLDPCHEKANWQLGQLLAAAEQTDEAQPFLKRSRQLEKLFDTVSRAMTGTNMAAVHEAATLSEELGLIREACGWARLMLHDSSATHWAPDMLHRLQPKLENLELRRMASDSAPTLALNLSRLPLPDFSRVSTRPSNTPSFADHDAAFRPLPNIVFEDVAADAGLNFQYFNGHPADQQTRRMYEFNGGGAAVLDLDKDGWPDLYLTQGCAWPPASPEQHHSDGLFRNSDLGQFSNVTIAAKVLDTQFSAGATAGDFNDDGWPDLYVTNIGENRFLQNNGDGTFSDVTVTTGTAGNDWSTSSAIADLNGDAFPDLYVVNYLSGADVFSRLCPDANGKIRSCSPRDFSAAQDRLYINQGDGRFHDVTEQSGIDVSNGKGLGLVVADFFNSGTLDVFVANDAVPNFLFVNEATAAGALPVFADRAIVTGLALNAEGRSQACMGVAVGDTNADGLVDVFVTNFHNETNTLYQQQPGQTFRDATHEGGLSDASLKMLGFGTQFLDADLDGVLDLIVANGHIDDLTDVGIAYEMPAQFFRGVGTGRFEDQSGKHLGAYFSHTHLGRGLAKLDWDRDGMEDAVISHLHEPVALLTNRTANPGNHITIQLQGVISSRDAIGAFVTVVAGDRTYSQQLTAGSGFQSSNQRQLVFGVGQISVIDEITIQWPAGGTQKYYQLPANQSLLLTEGRRRPVSQ